MQGSEIQYEINKGVNRAIEFRGLKAQYIYYLAVGLAVLLLLFVCCISVVSPYILAWRLF
nr:DUF4133 domain-containing protein [Arachidicoccus ginsenosidivorans]